MGASGSGATCAAGLDWAASCRDGAGGSARASRQSYRADRTNGAVSRAYGRRDMSTTIYVSAGATTVTAPSNWSSIGTTIEAIGESGTGGPGSITGSSECGGGGGQGGGYGKVTSPAHVAAGNVLTVQVGAGASSTSTFLQDNTSTTIAQGDYGASGTNIGSNTPGGGGNHSQTNIGATVTATGGVGGNSANATGAGGGGSAGGPAGNGGAGGATTATNAGAAGGGGCDSGGGGLTGVNANGGAGGNGPLGTGSGAGGTGNTTVQATANGTGGTANTGGGGGGGGAVGTGGILGDVAGVGGAGALYTLYDSTHGPGGGGGGGGACKLASGTTVTGGGGNGGGYGGGGGGAGGGTITNTIGTAGSASPGLIIIIYTPAVATFNPAWAIQRNNVFPNAQAS